MKRLDARLLAGSAVTAALLVPIAIFGGPAFAGGGPDGHASAAQYQYRVTICHITGSKKHPAHTIKVAQSAVAAHLRHGDHLGPCTGTETPRKHGKPAAGNKTGDDSGHGNANPGHGNDDPGHGNGNGKGHGHK